MNRAWAIVLAAFLAACATLTSQSDGLDYSERTQRIAAATSWELRGRISVDTGERGYQGRFTWRQDGEQMRLLIRGPLGVGGIEVRGTDDRLVVTARNESRELLNPEAELSDLLGWWVPVSSLRFWLLGTADSRFVDQRTLSQNGLLRTLEQREWTLAYRRYGLSNDVLIPRDVELRHAPLELAVTVDDWQLRASGSP